MKMYRVGSGIVNGQKVKKDVGRSGHDLIEAGLLFRLLAGWTVKGLE
jgi:hypothetical protein